MRCRAGWALLRTLPFRRPMLRCTIRTACSPLGGDLTPPRLLNAYRHGIFPWFSEGQPILWWCPDPRMVFRTDGVRLSSRFRRALRRSRGSFVPTPRSTQVIAACATVPRPGQAGTWITPACATAYVDAAQVGAAHSGRGVRWGTRWSGHLWRGDRPDVLRREHVQRASGWIQGGAGRVGPAIVRMGVAADRCAGRERRTCCGLGAEAWPRGEFLRSVRALTAHARAAGGMDRYASANWPPRLLAD